MISQSKVEFFDYRPALYMSDASGRTFSAPNLKQYLAEDCPTTGMILFSGPCGHSLGRCVLLSKMDLTQLREAG